ncbi:hypothetical protein TRAPUB_1505 [Trametes pubescens]|uniref:Uncharacterized protein n=1 Tax=Trametes pubescens TaxID=154538 RepID=A0A1M2W7P1_TRAPU|nr:hypothetical protein TRAPUB_1505 [Trametes pubescens]
MSGISPPETPVGEPLMTDRQRGKLYYLWQQTGVYIPFADNNQRGVNKQQVTMREAWALIGMLERGERPSEAYINSLGRSSTVDRSRDEGKLQEGGGPCPPLTEEQMTLLNGLFDLMGISHEERLQKLARTVIFHGSMLTRELAEYRERGGVISEDHMGNIKRVMKLIQELPN